MDQPDFALLHEASPQEPLLDQQANTSSMDGMDCAGATKSKCTDCDCSKTEQPDFSPLFVPASSAMEPGAAAKKASFASRVERAKFLW